MSPENDLFEIHTPTLQRAMWLDVYPNIIYNGIMSQFKPEIIRNWVVTDIREGCLVRWIKRDRPLTDDELLKIFPYYKSVT